MEKNGYGVMKYSNGKIYEGEYKEGKKHGKGKMKYPNGDVYDGNYINGVKSGKGTYSFNNGDKYIGNFVKDKKEGMGEYFFADGRYYKGEFRNNQIVNKDDIKTQTIYTSQINVRETSSDVISQNTDLNANASKKFLKLKENNPIKSSNRDNQSLISREEELKSIEKMQTLSMGEKYQGNLVDGLKEGEGVCVYQDGNRYEGNFTKNKKWIWSYVLL